jgi:hypothetical protein
MSLRRSLVAVLDRACGALLNYGWYGLGTNLNWFVEIDIFPANRYFWVSVQLVGGT